MSGTLSVLSVLSVCKVIASLNLAGGWEQKIETPFPFQTSILPLFHTSILPFLTFLIPKALDNNPNNNNPGRLKGLLAEIDWSQSVCIPSLHSPPPQVSTTSLGSPLTLALETS
jgi:hypothetical protein